MRVTHYRTFVRFGTATAVGLILLAACDQQSERADRASGVVEAAIDQISGGEAGGERRSAMKRASLVERALAGQIRSEVEVDPETLRSRFAVGSIIAKPRELEMVPLMAIESAPELVMEAPISDIEVGEMPTRDLGEAVIVGEELEIVNAPASDDPLMTVESGEARRGIRVIRDNLPGLQGSDADKDVVAEEGAVDPEADAPVIEEIQAPTRSIEARLPQIIQQRQEMKVARRAVLSERSLTVQVDARTRMEEAMNKYGLVGEVELSRGGAMVIQLDAVDPTQFSPEDAAQAELPQMAYKLEDGCPDTLDPQTIRRNAALATECVVQDLISSGEFEYVEKDFIFTNQFVRKPPETPTVVFSAPDDPLWDLQWHFQNNGTEDGQSAGGAGFEDFWSRQTNQGSLDVVVAVVDTGLQLNHPDIVDSPNVAPGWDMVSDPRMGNDGDGRDSNPDDPGDLCDPSVPFAENSYHGTHVAGTIGAAATNNGAGVAGGAWNVTIVPVRALGKCGGRLSDINDAIRWAGGLVPAVDTDGSEVWNLNPADIINLSIGLFEYCPASLQDAIDAVTERGVTVVSAAGNARISTRFYAPGGCDNVISVAAGDARGQITPYSNYGDEVDVLAPGGDLTRDDNGDGRPDGVLSTKLSTDCYDPVTGDAVDNCYYAYEQGTSMAAPHVSAALALLQSKFPEKTGTDIQAMLLGALDARSPEQCAGDCSQYPGAVPIEGSDNLCMRPCGGGLLNLANIADE